MEEKHKRFKITYCLAVIFAKAKMMGHLSGLHNKLRELNTTVSLSCIFKIATSCPKDGGSKDAMKETQKSTLLQIFAFVVVVFVFLRIICQGINPHNKSRERERRRYETNVNTSSRQLFQI